MKYMRTAVSVAALLAALLLGTAGTAAADSTAIGTVYGSPGVLSGNLVQAPVSAPVVVYGNTVGVVGVLNPVFGGYYVDGYYPGVYAYPLGWHHFGWHHGWVLAPHVVDCD